MDDVEQRRSLGAERAAVYRMIRIALDVDDVGNRILGFVPKAVNEDAERPSNKVQVLRVSLAAVSLNGRTEAARASPSPPKPRAPKLDAASPAAVILMKPRRLSCMATLSTLRRAVWNRQPRRTAIVAQASEKGSAVKTDEKRYIRRDSSKGFVTPPCGQRENSARQEIVRRLRPPSATCP